MLSLLASTFPSTPKQIGLFALTIAAYFIARWAYLRSGSNPLLIPILTSVMLVVVGLLLLDIPYIEYAQSVKILQILIGPATVALAIPLYVQLPQLKKMWFPLTVALLTGGIVAMISTLVIVWVFGGSFEMLISLAPKSATMPIAIPASEAVGGIGSLVAVSVAVTGIVGVLISRTMFRWLKVTKNDVVQGFSLGLTSHAIGVAHCVQVNQQAAAAGALAMGLNGLLTAMIMPFLPLVFKILGLY